MLSYFSQYYYITNNTIQLQIEQFVLFLIIYSLQLNCTVGPPIYGAWLYPMCQRKSSTGCWHSEQVVFLQHATPQVLEPSSLLLQLWKGWMEHRATTTR